ncbi:MAG: hypothetical protein U5J83_11175 [Bryobacterales bacterium]|nr:hypothetical protein [Bryobacterales bacterium]
MGKVDEARDEECSKDINQPVYLPPFGKEKLDNGISGETKGEAVVGDVKVSGML